MDAARAVALAGCCRGSCLLLRRATHPKAVYCRLLGSHSGRKEIVQETPPTTTPFTKIDLSHQTSSAKQPTKAATSGVNAATTRGAMHQLSANNGRDPPAPTGINAQEPRVQSRRPPSWSKATRGWCRSPRSRAWMHLDGRNWCKIGVSCECEEGSAKRRVRSRECEAASAKPRTAKRRVQSRGVPRFCGGTWWRNGDKPPECAAAPFVPLSRWPVSPTLTLPAIPLAPSNQLDAGSVVCGNYMYVLVPVTYCNT